MANRVVLYEKESTTQEQVNPITDVSSVYKPTNVACSSVTTNASDPLFSSNEQTDLLTILSRVNNWFGTLKNLRNYKPISSSSGAGNYDLALQRTVNTQIQSLSDNLGGAINNLGQTVSTHDIKIYNNTSAIESIAASHRDYLDYDPDHFFNIKEYRSTFMSYEQSYSYLDYFDGDIDFSDNAEYKFLKRVFNRARGVIGDGSKFMLHHAGHIPAAYNYSYSFLDNTLNLRAGFSTPSTDIERLLPLDSYAIIGTITPNASIKNKRTFLTKNVTKHEIIANYFGGGMGYYEPNQEFYLVPLAVDDNYDKENNIEMYVILFHYINTFKYAPNGISYNLTIKL